MSSAVARLAERGDRSLAEQHLEWLGAQILRNRFLPLPPQERIFVGDGGFLAIGVEFLGWFVHHGGLAPHHRVLDLGCGIGRMALPLTQYLDAGSYDGIDVAAEGIAWCNDNIARRYDNFRFHHIDLQHPLYNPAGAIPTTAVQLPFADGSFDFVCLCSVLTHLVTAEIDAYAREIRRVLAPGGRCFFTAFMLNPPARQGLREGRGALSFDGDATAPEIYANPDATTAAVAYDEDYLLARFLAARLRRRIPPVYGRWSGRATPGPCFQDISVLDADTPLPADAPTRIG